jgi:hypothetical protein
MMYQKERRAMRRSSFTNMTRDATFKRPPIPALGTKSRH